MFREGVLPKHALGYMSSIFLVTIHSFQPHYACVIAINSNSRLPTDVMSRQGLIDRGVEGTCPNMFKGGFLPKHALGSMSSLLLVTVHSLKLHPACVIAINSK